MSLIAFCPDSNFRIDAERSPLRCPYTNGPLEYTDLPAFDPALIDSAQPGHWRYAAMLPVTCNGEPPITLGEGWTPLIEDKWRGVPLRWKLETLMPTGSYKDRGVSVMVNWLLRRDAEVFVDDSSGNAGASLACYGARAKMPVSIYVPESAPEPKKVQIAVYGAELVEVSGSRADTRDAAFNATRYQPNVAYASHAWHPAFLLGQMTLAWEIWEQLGKRVPAWLVAPVGNGGLLLGAWRGFEHLHRCGFTQSLPRLVAVQAAPYTPLVEALERGQREAAPNGHSAHISADGIAIAEPVRGRALLRALYQSEGTAIAVDESSILKARDQLARRGLFVEPTSATVAAAIPKLQPLLAEGDEVVALLTGHGLKKLPQLE